MTLELFEPGCGREPWHPTSIDLTDGDVTG
jgi:hypothetical protein